MADGPLISSVFLNWNRKDLLEQTLESYAGTVSVPFEAFIVDNGSTDGSREFIEDFCRRHKGFTPLLLESNQGGDAINLGLEKCAGEYLHISENDLVYLPEWTEKALEAFAAFPELGQLSLFGPVPTDEEVWDVKPCSLKHSKGVILYEANGNVGTSSIIRRGVWDAGIRVGNIESSGPFKLPNDIELSSQISRAGYLVAYSPHYLVRNLGHYANEIDKRIEYYRNNYNSKPWIGWEGLLERRRLYDQTPKPIRQSFLFTDEAISPEKTFPTDDCPKPQLWSMLDGWTAEVESLEFIYSIVRLVKPNFVLETGTWHGAGAYAMGLALRRNGFGSLVSIEIDEDSYLVSKNWIERADLQDRVRLIHGSSLEYTPAQTIDLLFLDSATEIREAEFDRFRKWLKPGSTVIFHDTNEEHEKVRAGVQRLIDNYLIKALFITTPRGIVIGQYTAGVRPPLPSLSKQISELRVRLGARTRLRRLLQVLKLAPSTNGETLDNS